MNENVARCVTSGKGDARRAAGREVEKEAGRETRRKEEGEEGS